MNELTHLSLFAGIGGFSVGFDAVGFKTIAFSEIDPVAAGVHQAIWPDAINVGDIKQFDCGEFLRTHGSPYVVTGGVPCQPASALGLMRGTSDERWLWPEAIRVVRELRPAFAVFENPPAIITLDGGKPWNGIVSELVALGYDCLWDVFPAAALGAGHLRERVILVCADLQSIAERSSPDEGNAKPRGWDAREIVAGGNDSQDGPDLHSAGLQGHPRDGEREDPTGGGQ